MGGEGKGGGVCCLSEFLYRGSFFMASRHMHSTREAKVEWFIDPFFPEKCKTGKLSHEARKMEESTFNFIFESAVFKKRPEDALF